MWVRGFEFCQECDVFRTSVCRAVDVYCFYHDRELRLCLHSVNGSRSLYTD